MLARTAYKMKPPLAARLVSGHPLARDLVCYLPMREGSGIKLFDATGRGHHGNHQLAPSWVTGKFGRALELNGTSQFISIPNHADFTPALTPFSISALVYMHDATTFLIAGKYLANNREWRLLTDSDDKLYWYVYDESAGAYLCRYYNTTITSLQNTWLHVVTTYDGGTAVTGLKIYLNGVRADNKSAVSGTFVAVEKLAATVYIGRTNDHYSDGIFSRMMFWRRVLTQSDVNKLHVRSFRMFDSQGVRRRRLLGVGT